MWFRRQLDWVRGSIILSYASSDHCLFVGFYPSSHIVLLSPPLPSLLFRKMEEWLHYFQLCPGFLPQSGTACASNASDRVVTALDATPAPRCNIEHWDSRGAVPCCLDDFLWNLLESLKKGNFRANRNQLGIMTIHPSHAYQHGSSQGLQMMLCQPQLVLKWWCPWSLCGPWLKS